MQAILLDFQRLSGTTWLLASLLLSITLYFQFTRFFSLRNWDIISLSLLAPGLILATNVDRQLNRTTATPTQMVTDLAQDARPGYVWLLAVSTYFLLRALADLFLARRPRLEANLNSAGLAFLAVSLMGYLMFEIVTREPDPAGRRSARIATTLVNGNETVESKVETDPASVLFMSQIAAVQSQVVPSAAAAVDRPTELERGVAQSAAILCHLGIVAALIIIGWRHFDSPTTGVAMGTLYLLVPMTALNAERIDHLLPAAFLIWALASYRHAWLSGILMGLAGAFVYPLFLLPLWISFYWGRRAKWFITTFVLTTAGLVAMVIWLGPFRSYLEVWTTSVAWKAWEFQLSSNTLGAWTSETQFYRLPIFILYLALAIGAGFWPPQKNLADLIALSVALVLGVQFWYSDRGGAYVLWYLPLLVVMLFRPNLSEVRAPAPAVKAAA